MITSINGLYAALDPRFRELERNASALPSMPAQESTDEVNIHTPVLLSDEEAAEAMSSVSRATQESPAEALSVHRGLTYDRVMQLLEGL